MIFFKLITGTFLTVIVRNKATIPKCIYSVFMSLVDGCLAQKSKHFQEAIKTLVF